MTVIHSFIRFLNRYPPVGAFATQRLIQPGVQPLVRTVKGSANVTMEKLIELYKMQEHPEGGWFVETYRSELPVAVPVRSELKK